MKDKKLLCVFIIGLVLVLGGCSSKPSTPTSQSQGVNNASELLVTFTLQTAMMDGMMVYIGSGGSIDGIINPDLVISEGTSFQIVLVNGDGMPHDLAVPEIGIQTAVVAGKGKSVSTPGATATIGEYTYYCTVSGHRQAGMEGRLSIKEP